MDQVSQAVLALLRGALWGEEAVYPADTDWQAVTKELQAQAIMGVIAGSDIPECVPAQTRAQWESLALLQGSRFYQLLHQQDQLLTLLAKNDIPLVILKGMAAAMYYPAPEMRSMGDVDFLVPREQVEKAYELMLANGYTLYYEKDANNKHIIFSKAEARFELHRYFGIFDSVDKMKYMDGILQNGLQNIKWISCAESRFPILPPLANGLVLLEHAAGHFRDGLGLRHMVDWMMYVHSCLTDAFWQQDFYPTAQALGLDVFAKTLTKMCQIYLGLPQTMHWCESADTKACDQLMDYVLEQGNFGGKQTDFSSKVERVLSDKRSLVGWLRQIQESGMCHWEAAKRYAVLKPFAWLYGGCRYACLALGRKQAIAHLWQEKNISNQRNNLAKSVGLNYGKQRIILRDNQFISQKN